MSMDLSTLQAIVAELRPQLVGALVNKIYQPGPAEIVLRLWNGRATLQLLISTAPGATRLHLIRQRPPNPMTPPRFSQLLRARLHRLMDIVALPTDRIVRLEFAGDAGQRWTLLAELFGIRANLMLLDESNTIVDALRRQSGTERSVLPGHSYQPPPGSVPVVLAADEPPESAEQALGHGPRQLQASRPEDFASLSEAAEAYYAEQAAQEIFAGRGALLKLVRRAARRIERRLERIATDEIEARQAERYRELGDLLLGNLHRLNKGQSEALLEDWYAEPPVPLRICLDPALNPQQNAERYYRRHRKGARALEHCARRRAESEAERDWLARVAHALTDAEDLDTLADIRVELSESGLLPRTHRRRMAPVPQPPLQRVTSPGGFALLWGKNNRGNDYVTRQLTGASDLWFHAQGLPGAHLVLKNPNRVHPLPEADVQYAAELAAGYSRGRTSAWVEVMVALGHAVRKPRGSRPGLASVQEYRTLRVAPRRLAEAIPTND